MRSAKKVGIMEKGHTRVRECPYNINQRSSEEKFLLEPQMVPIE